MNLNELLADVENSPGRPTRASPLFEQIHELLWNKILAGEIEPRQRLKDIEWARKLGVSRTPVREAMRQMQQEGVLLPLAVGGYQVRPVSFEDFTGLYQCRAVLAGLAAKEAAARFTKKAEARFVRLLKQVDRSIDREDLDEAFSLKTTFYNDLIDLSGNTHLVGLYQSITKLVMFYRSALLNQAKAEKTNKADYISGLKGSQRTHRAILKAITEGDGERARKLIETHLLDSIDEVAERIIK